MLESEADRILILIRIRILYPNLVGWIPPSLLPSPPALWKALLASPSVDLEVGEQTMAMLAVLVAKVEGLAVATVVEGEVEPTSETEGLVAAKEAGILVAEIRIRREA